jgi:pyruvate dehydrogenase E2 component (dihydrolipoamide acetyltransferase)
MEIKVPDIGDFSSVAVIEVLVAVGGRVEVDQPIVVVESDKASLEIPASHSGVIKELKVQVGSKVSEGSVVLVLESATPGTAPGGTPIPAPAAAPAAAGAPIEVEVPDIGDVKDVIVIEVLVKPGDTIEQEQSLITVESDKASMEIPSSATGTLKELKVKVGDKVNVGDLIALLEGAGAAASPAPAPAAVPATGAAVPTAAVAVAPATAAAAPAHDPTVALTGQLPHASPSVRKFARELGVPLDEVKGGGPKGSITQEDVQNFSKAVMSGAVSTKAAGAKAPAGGGVGAALGLIPWPKVDFTKFGTVERKDLSRIKKLSGANLHRNWVMIPHVTNNDEADITELEAFRVSTNKENEKSGVKVTMLAFVIKAVVAALKKFPEFNTSLDGDQLVYKQYYHIGFAADTPNGLVVPVLKDADKKGIIQISQEMGELAKKARDGKLGSADMQGGCFSISSLGGIGGTHFTPIINAPEVAILGLSKGQMKPVWDGKQFVPRLTLPLSLSYDHRVIDGAAAARFNAYLGRVLADYRQNLL